MQKGPLRLYYSVFTNPAKRLKVEAEVPMIIETDTANNSDLKTEVSGYFTDEEKHNSETSLTLESDLSKTDSVLAGDGIDIDIEEIDKENMKDKEKKKKECKTSVSSESKATSVDSHSKNSDKKNENKSADIKLKGNIANLTKSEENIVYNANTCKSGVNKKDVQPSDSENSESAERKEVNKDNKLRETIEDDKLELDNKNIEKNDVENSAISCPKSATKQIEEKVAKVDTQTETPDMVEASTDTIPGTSDDIRTGVKQIVPEKTKLPLKDDDVSEPVVSSTQNTQGCQTEPPETGTEILDIPNSSDSESTSAASPSYTSKRKVDVSCETDNFVVQRKNAKESVSVSTDTDDVSQVTKRKSVECSTDVYDFPGSDVEFEKKRKIDSSTDLSDFPIESSKRKTLSVDCSTDIADLYMSTNKRKSFDTEHNGSETKIKKTDSKIPKRSMSYSGHLTTPKAAYLAQPLSPTKITLKFTQPKSPGKTCPKSPSRSETSGFQSQYQSFVMELPENAYRFQDEEPLPSSKSLKHSSNLKKPASSTILPQSQSLPGTEKKSLSKSGRPRGRPPKNRTMDNLVFKVKEKKHKSRSHSPKHKKSSEKERDKSSDSQKEKSAKSAKSSSQERDKKSNAYSWINKIDTDASSSEQKLQKNKTENQTNSENPPSNLRIPKQFLYYSNGQYTLASVSSLNSLKQSSPVSPPPKTVFTSEVKNEKLENRAKSDTNEVKTSKIVTMPTKVDEKPKESIQDKPANVPELKPAKSVTPKPKETVALPSVSVSLSPVTVVQSQNKTVTHSKPPTETKSVSSPRPEINRTKQHASPIPAPKTAKVASSPHTAANPNPANTKEKPSPPVPKEAPVVTTSAPFPEYRHQSPFFASISGAKLSSPHRPAAHLNIPNLSSHFGGTHPLYAQRSFGNDRLGTPLYRSYSMGDKAASQQAAAKFEEQRRMEALAYMSPFLGYMHSHLVSSLPPPRPPQRGHYQESAKSLTYSDHATNGASSMSQNASRTFAKPNTPSINKGKEKSIDKIITQITEMRTKKETQEQVNGIDLSTKGSKKDQHGEKVNGGNKSEQKEGKESGKPTNNESAES